VENAGRGWAFFVKDIARPISAKLNETFTNV
jgi:hypothetical protein